VHRKGWHISWNKNYRSDNIQNTDTAENGDAEVIKSKRENTNVAINEITTEDKSSEVLNPEKISMELVDAAEPSSSHDAEDTPEDELPNSEIEESQDLKDLPLGGAYIFLGLFTAAAVGLAALGALEFAIGAILIAIAALVIMAHINSIKKGKNKNSHIRPSGFYNSILFAILCSVVLAYFIIYGGLSGLIGIIVGVFLVILIALLIFLAYQTKDLHHAEVQKQKEEKAAAQKEKDKEATPEEKKKNRIAGLIIGGLVLALFLTIGLLNN